MGPTPRRRAGLRGGGDRLHVAPGAAPWNPFDRGSRRRHRRVRLEPVGVPARDRLGRQPAVDPADLLPFTARRSVAAQLHRVPERAGAAAHPARRRRRRVQPGAAHRDGDHRALRLSAGSRRVPDDPGGGLRRRPGVRLVAGAGGANDRALQPGGRGAARRVRPVRDSGRAHPQDRVCRACRSLHGLGGLLRSVFRRLLPDDHRPLREFAPRAHHPPRAHRDRAMGVAAERADPHDGWPRRRPAVRPGREARSCGGCRSACEASTPRC